MADWQGQSRGRRLGGTASRLLVVTLVSDRIVRIVKRRDESEGVGKESGILGQDLKSED